MIRAAHGLMLPLACLLAGGAAAQTRPPAGPISAERLSADVCTLASDAFGGRAPGTPGEAKTVAWLIEQFKAMGAEPGGPAGGWTQPVPLIRTQMGRGTIAANGAAMTVGRDVYVSTVRPAERVSIAGAPLVFVGYGVSAPERGWDDFKGVNLKGKVAVFVVNDPDFEAASGEPVAGRFGGKRMTYYGRWTYKFEEAARRGGRTSGRWRYRARGCRRTCPSPSRARRASTCSPS